VIPQFVHLLVKYKTQIQIFRTADLHNFNYFLSNKEKGCGSDDTDNHTFDAINVRRKDAAGTVQYVNFASNNFYPNFKIGLLKIT